MPPLALPGFKRALSSGREAVIVAFGSSSTEGAHASDIAHSYPAILQARLSNALPTAHIAVLNRGIGGQDAQEEIPRIAQEVVGVRPDLVIWQVGANSAMRQTPADEFKRLVAAGVAQIQSSGVDVVLMDNQRAPAILASPEHIRIDQAIAEIAAASGAGLFSRGMLMEQWRDSGRAYADFIVNDGIHHNDLGYRCVAEALTGAIIAGLERPRPQKRLIGGR